MTDLEKEKIENIADYLGKEEILCQLSEECGELIQASLKYRRAAKGLTPVTVDEAYYNLAEEVGDVLLNIKQILYLFGIDFLKEVKEAESFKANRWWERINYGDTLF